jgi:putative sigma-54 modulation protein
MNINITAKTIELTPALKDYAEKRFGGISKFIQGEPSVSVEIGKTTQHHKQGEVFIAEINVVTPLGKQYRAVSEKSDIYEAIDDARNEIVRELTRDKEKKMTLFRRGAQRIKNLIKGLGY